MDLLWPKIVCTASNIYSLLHKNKFGTVNRRELPENFTITCHAGAMLTPANSLYSVKAAAERGADIIEFDVSFRPDGTPVIIHDEKPADNQGVLLEKALEIVSQTRKCQINLDLKSLANIAAVDKLVTAAALNDRVFYTGVFEDWVETVKNNSSIPYYLNYKISEKDATDIKSAQAVADKVEALGAIGINSNFKGASKLLVDTIHKNDLLVSLWTVNEIKDMAKALKLCPDNITTKKPNTLKNLIDT